MEILYRDFRLIMRKPRSDVTAIPHLYVYDASATMIDQTVPLFDRNTEVCQYTSRRGKSASLYVEHAGTSPVCTVRMALRRRNLDRCFACFPR